MRAIPLSVYCSLLLAGLVACAESGPLLRENSERSVDAMGGATGEPGAGSDAEGGSSPSEDSNVSEIPADCVFRNADNIAICAGTYLDVDVESWGGVAQLTDGRVLVSAQVSSSTTVAVADDSISSAGPGALLVLGQAGRTLNRLLWLGDRAGPVETNEAGFVATWNGAELLLLDSKLSPVWRVPLAGTVKRLDLGADGTVAVLLAGGEVSLWDASGEALTTFPILRPGTSVVEPLVHDVAISTGGARVFVVGAHEDPSGGCGGMVPFLRAYDATGDLLNRAYDFEDAQGNCASSEGLRVSVGGDGLLYYGGRNHGGNTVHLLDPGDLTAPAPLVSYDLFNQGHGKAIERYGFVGRFDPETLAIQLGQLLLPRDSEDVGGAFQIEEVLADERGRVAIAAQSSCCFPQRELTALETEVPGAYSFLETSVVLLSSDFLQRELWFSPTVDSLGDVGPLGFSWQEGLLSIVTGAPTSSSLFLQKPLQIQPAPLHLLTVPTP